MWYIKFAFSKTQQKRQTNRKGAINSSQLWWLHNCQLEHSLSLWLWQSLKAQRNTFAGHTGENNHMLTAGSTRSLSVISWPCCHIPPPPASGQGAAGPAAWVLGRSQSVLSYQFMSAIAHGSSTLLWIYCVPPISRISGQLSDVVSATANHYCNVSKINLNKNSIRIVQLESMRCRWGCKQTNWNGDKLV